MHSFSNASANLRKSLHVWKPKTPTSKPNSPAKTRSLQVFNNASMDQAPRSSTPTSFNSSSTNCSWESRNLLRTQTAKHPRRRRKKQSPQEAANTIAYQGCIHTDGYIVVVLKRLPHDATLEQGAALTPARIAAERKAMAEADQVACAPPPLHRPSNGRTARDEFRTITIL